MTDLQAALRALPMSSRAALIQLVDGGMPFSSLPGKTYIELTRRGVVDVKDGEPSLSDLGRALVAHLANGRETATRDRFIRVVRTAQEGVEADDLEQTFRNDFTPDELDLIAPVVAQLHETIERARK